VTVLCYHTVEPDCPSRVAVEPDAFRSHMEHLARRRRVVPPEEVPRLVDRRGRLPRGSAAVTFDDGLSGVADHAAPVLESLGIPSIVFVVAETLAPGGRTVDWVDDAPSDPGLRTLSPDDVRALAAGGMRIGSHSWAHRHLPDLTEAEVRADLLESRTLLEDVIGGPVLQLAYPRGQHAPHVRRAAEAAGYEAAFTLPETREEVGTYAIPRVGVYPGNGVRDLRVKLARRYLDLRLSPATATARAALRRVRG
jgi:peptidoglycan/xylan/chitin deacetylase (PgdA/CDA1 family)